MARQNERFKVTILNGTQFGEVLPPVPAGQPRVSLGVGLGMCTLCSIFGGAVQAETAVVQVGIDDTGTWFTVAGAVPAANTVISFVPPPARQMQIALSAPAAADRGFWVFLQYDMS